tara:strand:- start:6 stop:740 length:735 start_codon:yes stop_codon:yes gene_type:complete
MTSKQFIQLFVNINLLSIIVLQYIGENIHAIIDFQRILAPVNNDLKNIEILPIWGEIILSKLYLSLPSFYKTQDHCTGFLKKYYHDTMYLSFNQYIYSRGYHRRKNPTSLLYFTRTIFQGIFNTQNILSGSGYGLIISGTQYINLIDKKILIDHNKDIVNTLLYLYISMDVNEKQTFPDKDISVYVLYIKLIVYDIDEYDTIFIIPRKSSASNLNPELYTIRKMLIHEEHFKEIIQHPNIIKFN